MSLTPRLIPRLSAVNAILAAARAVIEDPKNWCQGVYARDSIGGIRVPTEPDACQFCAIGAVHRAADTMTSYGPTGNAIVALHTAAQNKFGLGSAATLNDARGHADVLAMFDVAIEATAPDEGTV